MNEKELNEQRELNMAISEYIALQSGKIDVKLEKFKEEAFKVARRNMIFVSTFFFLLILTLGSLAYAVYHGNKIFKSIKKTDQPLHHCGCCTSSCVPGPCH